MQASVTFIDETGKKVECKIVSMFKKDDNNYIAYTDDKEVDGKKDLLISRYTMEGDMARLAPIESDEEWNMVSDYLEREILKEEDEFDD